MVKVDRNWADQHLGTATGPNKPAQSPKRRTTVVGVIIAISLGMLLAAGGACAWYLIDANRVPEMAVVRHEKSPGAPTPFARRQVEAPPIAPVVAPEPILEPAHAAPMVDRGRAERAAAARSGIALMRQELADVAAQAAFANSVLAMRPRPLGSKRPQPWSAAETLDEIAIYLREHPNIGTIEAIDIQHHRDAAAADCTNARRRLRELADRSASLESRISKAKLNLLPSDTESR